MNSAPVRSELSSSHALARGRVLVVDDVANNRDLLIRRLKRLGAFEVVEAENGQQALDAIARNRFDLVLLDIMMPVMNGHEVLERLHAEGRLHDLPVIVISALSEIDVIAQCIEQGAEDFILKPFNPVLLRARVLASLEKKTLRDLTRHELARKRAELAEARRLQLALAPPPAVREAAFATVEIDLALEPAEEVGGDLVDHFPVGGRLQVMALGDVSDKGAGAALMMARTCALLRGLAARPDAEALFRQPERALAVCNAALAQSNPGCMFVTLFLASLDVTNGRLAYVRAGHVPPVLRRASGELEPIRALDGLPLGLDEAAVYRSSITVVAPGDCLLAVTDGVTEASAPDGALFGEAQVADWLAASPAPRVADLIAAVRAHEAGGRPSDDVGVLILKLTPPTDGAAPARPLLSGDLPPTPEAISDLTGRVVEALTAEGVDLRAAHHTGLALDELLMNLGTHGEARTAMVRVGLAEDRVEVEVEDDGASFDPRRLPWPDVAGDLQDRAVGGLGAFLVLSLADRFDHRREDGRNVMQFWLARTGGPSE